MGRRLLTLAAAVSAVLCVAAVVLWVRSYWVADSWAWSDGADWPRRVYRMGHRREVAVAYGHVYVIHDTSWWFPPQQLRHRAGDPAAACPPFVPLQSALGLQWAEYIGTPMAANVPVPLFVMYRIVGIPGWMIAVSLAVLPAARLLRALRVRRRIRSGRCPVCGYDLRATPARCPECGALPA